MYALKFLALDKKKFQEFLPTYCIFNQELEFSFYSFLQKCIVLKILARKCICTFYLNNSAISNMMHLHFFSCLLELGQFPIFNIFPYTTPTKLKKRYHLSAWVLLSLACTCRRMRRQEQQRNGFDIGNNSYDIIP